MSLASIYISNAVIETVFIMFYVCGYTLLAYSRSGATNQQLDYELEISMR